MSSSMRFQNGFPWIVAIWDNRGVIISKKYLRQYLRDLRGEVVEGSNINCTKFQGSSVIDIEPLEELVNYFNSIDSNWILITTKVFH